MILSAKEIRNNRIFASFVIFLLIFFFFVDKYLFVNALFFVITALGFYAYTAFSKNRIRAVLKSALFIMFFLAYGYLSADYCGKGCTSVFNKPYRNCYIFSGCINESFQLKETKTNNLINYSITFLPSFVIGVYLGLKSKK